MANYRREWYDKAIPARYALVLLLIGVGLFGIVFQRNKQLPLPLKITDIKANPRKFIAERANFELKELSHIGPKLTGSYENEVLAAEFILRELKYIAQNAEDPGLVEIDLQKVTGSYDLRGFVNYYSGVQNIVLRLKATKSTNSSVLVNCHFDSVILSPGTSDDGLNCAVMIEVFRVLSQTTHNLKHDVIFLFNGAEETPLQASHGFITQHKWARSVKAFINLEACGAGGREILFQTGPHHPWLVKLYASSVPHPHGMVVAEEIFQSGLIPSDTDFRIFRDFGDISGMDFAHSSNGYVYHTKYDNLDQITLGTLQHTGDNLLELIKAIASSDELHDRRKQSLGKVVYFDLFGWLMITYDEILGEKVNIFVAFVSLFVQGIIISNIRDISSPEMVTYFFSASLIQICGWILAFCVNMVTGVVLGYLNCTMSWYSHPSLIFPLYFGPALMSFSFCNLLFRAILTRPMQRQSQAQILTGGLQFVWCVFMLASVLLKIRSSFILMLLLACPTLGNILVIYFKKQHSPNIWLYTYLLSSILPISLALYMTVLAFNLFIPITGRIGPAKNPEIFIGLLSLVLSILSTNLIAPLIVFLENPSKTFWNFKALYIITFVAIVVTPIAFPYSGSSLAPAPQRLIVQHTSQIFYDQDGRMSYHGSGYWVIYLDYNNPGYLKKEIPDIDKAVNVKPFCDEQIYCGLPVFSPVIVRFVTDTYWIPAMKPTIRVPPTLKITEREWISPTVQRMAFTVKGPNRMGIFLSPTIHAKIVNWNFNCFVTAGEPTWGNRSTYFINFVDAAKPFSQLDFSVDLEIEDSDHGFVLDIAVAGHYLTQQEYTEEFKSLLENFPDWAHVTHFVSNYISWKF